MCVSALLIENTDQLAKVLLGSQLQETIEEMKKLFGKQAPQQSQRRRMAIRTRWAEDTILECIHANGITQIVNLGIGLLFLSFP